MSQNENEKLDKILAHLETQGQEIHLIKRGMYGDPLNGTNGLIKDNLDQERRIKSLEEDGKKQKWIIAGFSFSVPVITMLVKEWWANFSK